jgi:hypothetical protein
MNPSRRIRLVAAILVASAAAGAGVGLVVVGSMLLLKVGHLRPQLLWELVKLGGQAGALFGVLLGPPTILGFLRRVPLGRLARDVLFGVTAGGVTGVALSLTFAEPRPAIPLIIAGSIAGLAIATSRLWARFRQAPQPTSVSAAG